MSGKIRTKNRILLQKIPTSEKGIFYKEIVNQENKVVDKIFLIRYRYNEKDKLVTIGKYSQGIRINYCKNKRNEILNNIRLGENPTNIQTKRSGVPIIPLNTLANEYFEYIKMHTKDHQNTKSRYDKHIKPYIGHIDAERVSQRDIESIQKEKIKTLAPKTVNHITQTIGAIYNFSIDRELFNGKNPTKRIKTFKVDNKRERFLTKEEIDVLIEEVSEDQQLLLFVELALTTGGRLSTITNIKKKDLNFSNDIIKLYDFKNKSTYNGFIQEKIKPMLHERLGDMNQNDSIVDIYKTIDLKRIIQRKLKPILDRLFNKGIKENDRKNRVVIHTFRHTFASHLAINGTPIYTIQKLMNHRDINMTMRYAKLSPDSGKDMVKELYI